VFVPCEPYQPWPVLSCRLGRKGLSDKKTGLHGNRRKKFSTRYLVGIAVADFGNPILDL